MDSFSSVPSSKDVVKTGHMEFVSQYNTVFTSLNNIVREEYADKNMFLKTVEALIK